MAFEQWKKDQKLKEFPNGYQLEETAGSYNCIVCYKTIKGKEVWWDQSGPKCELCQKAILKKIIPHSVCKGRLDNWYAMWQLKDKFGISSPTARKLVRNGELKARIVPDEQGNPYYYVFLKKENPKLVEYEENHKYVNTKCKCSDSTCGACLATVCCQGDCLIHPIEKKRKPRQELIEKLRAEQKSSLERSTKQELDEHIRNFNKKDAEEKGKYIEMLENSLSPKVEVQNK